MEIKKQIDNQVKFFETLFDISHTLYTKNQKANVLNIIKYLKKDKNSFYSFIKSINGNGLNKKNIEEILFLSNIYENNNPILTLFKYLKYLLSENQTSYKTIDSYNVFYIGNSNIDANSLIEISNKVIALLKVLLEKKYLFNENGIDKILLSISEINNLMIFQTLFLLFETIAEITGKKLFINISNENKILKIDKLITNVGIKHLNFINPLNVEGAIEINNLIYQAKKDEINSIRPTLKSKNLILKNISTEEIYLDNFIGYDTIYIFNSKQKSIGIKNNNLNKKSDFLIVENCPYFSMMDSNVFNYFNNVYLDNNGKEHLPYKFTFFDIDKIREKSNLYLGMGIHTDIENIKRLNKYINIKQK